MQRRQSLQGTTAYADGMVGCARRLTSWLLLIAFLNAVLAPSVGAASGGQATIGPLLMPFCSVDGDQLVDVEWPATDAESTAVLDAQHDGFCLLCVSPATLARIGVAGLLLDVFHAIPPLVWDDPEPRLTRAWHPAHARAPPVGA